MPLRSWLETLQSVFASSSTPRTHKGRRRPADDGVKARLAETLEPRLYLSAALPATLDPRAAEISQFHPESPTLASQSQAADQPSVRPDGFWYVPPEFQGDVSMPDEGHDDEVTGGNGESDPFVINGFRWPQPNGSGAPVTITYSYSNLLDGGLGGNLSPAQLTAAVEEALGQWASVAPLHFVEVADGGPAVSDADYSPGGYPHIRFGHEFIDGATGANVLAHAYYPTGSGLAGDVHFDNSNTWHLGPETGVDFLEVAVHELGHALGLGHSPMPSDGGRDAIMNPYYGSRFFGGLGNSYLLQDDIDGIQALYGAGAGGVTPLNGGHSGSGDDHGDSPAEATPIAVGGVAGGRFEVGGDRDWFSFEVRTGRTYVFATTLVTAPDTKLELLDSTGTRSLQFDDDGGEGLASRIEWQSDVDGTVYLKVEAFSDSQTGAYTLAASELAVSTGDDHGNASTTATVLSIGTTVNGRLESGGDEDYFGFDADAGSVYRFETRLGTLSDTTLALFDGNGTALLDFNDDGGEGRASSIEWAAPRNGRYYLRVRAFSATQTGTYELSVRRLLALGVPIAQSPSGTISDTAPTFRWTPADHATRYEVRVVDLTLNRIVVDNVAVAGASYTPSSPLTNGHSFRWQVRAVSAAGIAGAWSGVREFSVQAATVGTPIPSDPPAITYHSRPTFAWSPVAGAARYDLWVNDLTTGQSGVIRNTQLTRTTFTPAAKLPTGHRYLWCVRAIDAEGRPGEWSPHRAFFITTPVGTPIPGELSGTQVGTSQTFAWTAAPGAVRYDLWVNDLTTGQIGVIRRADVTSTHWTDESSLALGHSYVWAVRGINADGIGGEWSEHRWFTVKAPVGTPSAISPLGQQFGATQTFEWSPVRDAVRYDLWVNDLTTRQSGVIREAQITANRYTAHNLRGGHVYQWAVRGFDANGAAGQWSETAVFAVVATVGVPTLGGPGNLVVGTTQTFAWSSVAGAARYDLWVNDLTTGESGVIRNQNIVGTTYTASPELTAGHRYIWAVRALDAHGAPGLWSEARVFTIAAAIGAPTLLAPTGTQSGSSQTFEWSAVAGADHYDLWVNDLTTGQSGVVRNRLIRGTSYTANLTPGHNYIWTVRAIDSQGAPATWAAHGRFAVAERLAAPTPAGPSGTVGSTPTFEWSAVHGADTYEMLVRNLTTGGNEVFRQSAISATHYRLTTGLAAGETYRWWVRAVRADGDVGPWSDYRTFTVVLAEIRLRPSPQGDVMLEESSDDAFSEQLESATDHATASIQQHARHSSQIAGPRLHDIVLAEWESVEWWVRSTGDNQASADAPPA